MAAVEHDNLFCDCQMGHRSLARKPSGGEAGRFWRVGYSPTNSHGFPKWRPAKGDASKHGGCWGSMLKRGVSLGGNRTTGTGQGPVTGLSELAALWNAQAVMTAVLGMELQRAVIHQQNLVTKKGSRAMGVERKA